MNSPTAVPSTVPSSVASGAMIRMSREPTITRENMSRPSWSVPNRCALDGALLIPSRFWAYGLCGAIAEPKIAQMIQIRRMIAPTMNVGECSSSRKTSRRISLRPAASAPASSTGMSTMLIRPPAAGSGD